MTIYGVLQPDSGADGNVKRSTLEWSLANQSFSLNHWLWAIPLLLLVAMLAFGQIDLFPSTTDEFFSMYNAGWLGNGPYSPTDVLASLRRHSPDHTPLYFILLNLWGNLVGHELAVGRVLTIHTSLICLAITYRLCRDFIAPVAGVFALIIIASNAFFNFYVSNVRMYPLLGLLAGALLWLYLRIVYRLKKPRFADYLALAATTYCLINTHAFSLLFMAMLGIYHLIVAPKNRAWLGISAAVAVAFLLFSPYLWVLVSEIGDVVDSKEHVAIGGVEAIWLWLNTALNEQPLLSLLPIVGLALGAKTRKLSLKPYYFLFIAYLLTMAALAESSTLILKDSMRHHVAGWMPFVFFFAAGLYGLYCLRKWLALLLLLYMIAGLSMQENARWWLYIVLRSQVFTQPPTHILSRLATQAEPAPAILGYPYDTLYASFALGHGGAMRYSQREHYFTRHGLTMWATDDLSEFEGFARDSAIDSVKLWLVQPRDGERLQQVDEARTVLQSLHYERCNAFDAGLSTVVEEYMWDMLDCQIPAAALTGRTDSITYQFYTAATDDPGDALLFIDKWSARDDDSLEHLRLSVQVISDEWNNLAQVDIPLAHDGKLRQFSIDVSKAPAGKHRLMAILYDSRTGERQVWHDNPGYPGEMLLLDEIVIS